MNKLAGAALVVLPLAVGGLVYANAQSQSKEQVQQANNEEGYICPATGEELPCRNCCPLNNAK